MKNVLKNSLIILYSLLIITTVFVVPIKSSSFNDATLYISAVLGYIGLVFLLAMYALGAKSVAGLFSNDLAQLYKWHSWLGKYGIFLIFLHPIFIVLSYGESWLYVIKPEISTNFSYGVTYGRLAFFCLFAVWVFSALARSKITYRNWKYLHYLVYLALPLSLLHVPSTGTSYSQLLLAKIYYLIILWSYLIFCILRLRSVFNFDNYKYSVISHFKPSHNTYILRMKPEDVAIDSKPGQYIFLKMGLWSEEHPFSVVDNRDELILMYRAFGRFSHKMTKLNVGDQVYLSKAYGRFTQEIEQQGLENTVFIAGGIGITPFIQRIFYARDKSKIKLFYCNRHPETAGLLKELRTHLNQNLIEIYSDNSRQTKAKFNAHFIEAHLPMAKQSNYFICGPKNMMKNLKQELVEFGVPAKQIFSENFDF